MGVVTGRVGVVSFSVGVVTGRVGVVSFSVGVVTGRLGVVTGRVGGTAVAGAVAVTLAGRVIVGVLTGVGSA